MRTFPERWTALVWKRLPDVFDSSIPIDGVFVTPILSWDGERVALFIHVPRGRDEIDASLDQLPVVLIGFIS